ncbi:MAG TPA: hypothetical protein VER76_11230 [Pyrinomonadaceae bacterium]|nr:hypothetical protein [Pyrinomonadaceae bacterium]
MKFNLPKFERLHILVLTLLVLLVPFSLYYWGFVRRQTSYFTEHKSRQLAVIGNQIGAKMQKLSWAVDNSTAELFRDAVEAKTEGMKEEALDKFKKTLALGEKLEPRNLFLPAQPKNAKAKLDKRVAIRWEGEREMSKLGIVFTGAWKDGSPAQSLEVEADLGGVLQQILAKEAFESVLIADAESGAVKYQHNRQSGSKLSIATLDALRDEHKKKIDHPALAQATNIQDVKLAGEDYKLFSRPVDMNVALSGSERPKWIVCGLISEGQFRRERWAVSSTVLILFTVVMILGALSWPFLKLWLMGAKDRIRMADVYFLFFAAMIGSALLTLFSLYVYTYRNLMHEADSKLPTFAREVHNNLHAEVRSALNELDRLNEDLLADTESHDLIAVGTGLQDSRAHNALQPKTLEKANILPEHILKAEQNEKIQHPYPFFTTAFWIDDERRQRIKLTTKDVTTPFITVPPTRAYLTNIRDERFLHLERRVMSGEEKQKRNEDIAKHAANGETALEACKKYNDGAKHHDFWLEAITSPLTGIESVIITKKFCQPYQSWIAALDTRLLATLDTVTPPGYGFSVIEANGRVIFHSELAQHFGENFYDECDERVELRAAVESRQSTELNADYLGSGHSLFTLPVKDFPGWTIITYRDKQILRTAQLELLVVASNLFLLYTLVLLTFFVSLYLWKLNATGKIEWLWARDEAIGFYRFVLVANVFICLLLGMAIIYLEREWLLSVAGVLPIFGLFVAAVSLKLSGKLRKSGMERSDNLRPVIRCRVWYVLMITTLLFLVSVMPAIAFFKLAYNEQMKLVAKHGQVKLAQDLRMREEGVKAQYAGLIKDLVERAHKDRLKEGAKQGQVKLTQEFREIKDRIEAEYGGLIKDLIQRRLNWSPAKPGRPLDVYQSVFLDTHRDETVMDGRPYPPPVTAQALRYDRYLSYLRPMVNRTSGNWASLVKARSADGAWEWSEETGNKLLLQTRETDAAEHAAPLRIMSTVPLWKLPVPLQTRSGTLWWISIILIFGLLFVLLRFVVLRVFLLNLDDPVAMLHAHDFNADDAPKKRFVVLGPPFLSMRWLLNAPSVKRLSLKEAIAEHDAGAEQNKVVATQGTEAERKGELLAIDDFDYRNDDPEWNMKRLLLLEQLQHDPRRVIVFSRYDPFSFCLAPVCGANGNGNGHQSNGALASSLMDRWMNVVSSFWVVHVEDKGERQEFIESLRKERHSQIPEDAQAGPSFAQYLRLRGKRLSNSNKHLAALFDSLADECEPRAYLQNVGRGIIRHPKFKDLVKELTAEQLVRLLLEQAEAYYKAVWTTCTPNQKLTLYYLAQDHLVSAKNVEVRRLMRRGLIVRDPDVRLMNKSFRQFILSTAKPEEIGAGERTNSSWSKLRMPLLLVMVGVALFLLITHPELYTSSMAIITALATGIPAIFQLLGMFQRGKPAAELAQLSGGATPPVA